MRLHPTGGLVQINSAGLKLMPQLSLLTLHRFTLQSGFDLYEPVPCQRKLKMLKMYIKAKADFYGHVRVQINIWSFTSHMADAFQYKERNQAR